MRLLTIGLLMLMTGCRSSDIADLITLLSLQECEPGEVTVTATLDINNNPFVTNSVFINVREVHDPDNMPKKCDME